MMLSTLTLIGSLLIAAATIPQPLASGDRFFAGGFRSVRGFKVRGAVPPATRFHAGGFHSLRGFQWRGPGTGDAR